MCTFYYPGKHGFGNMNMVDFLSQITSSPLRQWRDKDRNTGIQVLLNVVICSEEENVGLVCFPTANHFWLVCTLTYPCFFSPPLYVIPQELAINRAVSARLTACTRNPQVKPGSLLGSCMHRTICWVSLWMYEAETLSTVFHLHFFPLKIAAAMHELIKPLAIKLFLVTSRTVVINSFNMKISVKWQPWLKQWDWRSCMCEP